MKIVPVKHPDHHHYLNLQAKLYVNFLPPKVLPVLPEKFRRHYLLAKGFITIKHRGGGYQKNKSVYALSDQWRLWRSEIVFAEREREAEDTSETVKFSVPAVLQGGVSHCQKDSRGCRRERGDIALCSGVSPQVLG